MVRISIRDLLLILFSTFVGGVFAGVGATLLLEAVR